MLLQRVAFFNLLFSPPGTVVATDIYARLEVTKISIGAGREEARDFPE